VEKIAGVPYCEFLHQRIFGPLGMRDTQCLGERGALDRHAIGYAPVDPGEARRPTAYPPAPVIAGTFYFGAGNLVSTGGDLARWATALHHGKVLTAASYQEMTTPVRNGFGYGLQINPFRSHVGIDHSGSVQGFYSDLEYFPETDNIAVTLSNQNNLSRQQFTPGTHVIDSELMTIAADPKASVPSEGKAVALSTRVLRLYTGRYVSDDSNPSAFTISLHGNHLELLQDGPGHSPSELRGDYGEMDFYLSDSDAVIEFKGTNDAVLYDLRYSKALVFHRIQP
jgi:CubicO group peptidase (beta-lactamase class C family)